MGLYDLGEKDQSVYWFYEARFRAKLFLKTIDTTHVGSIGELSSGVLGSYEAFTELAGKYINGDAGCDVDNWVKIARTVKDDNPKPPELDKIFPKAVLVKRSQWQGINDEVTVGLGVLIDSWRQRKPSGNTGQRIISMPSIAIRPCWLVISPLGEERRGAPTTE